MNKLDYLSISMENKLCYKNDWMVRAFSVIEDVDLSKVDSPAYPFQLIRSGGIPYVVNGDGKPEPISGVKKGELVFTFREPIKVTQRLYPYLDKETESTIGNLIVNTICIAKPFKNKIAYLTGKITVSSLEKMIMSRLQDTPKEGEPRDDKFIYVDEYKEFVNSLFYLTNFTQLCVWSLTEKTIQAPPGVEKLKKELLSKYTEDDLKDPIILDKVQTELLKFDDEYLKDDPGGQYFADSPKMRDIRKKLYLIFGAEKGLVDTNKRQPVSVSLEDGWRPDDMPPMIDALRAGSYNRGTRTALGGELTKWLFRATTNIKVTETDCNTTLGLPISVTDNNYQKLMNLFIIINKGVILVDTLDLAKRFIGKTVNVRSPLFCHTKGMNFCEVCLGKNITNNKDGISLAIAEIGSMFLLMSMKSMHGKILSTTDVDLELSLS